MSASANMSATQLRRHTHALVLLAEDAVSRAAKVLAGGAR